MTWRHCVLGQPWDTLQKSGKQSNCKKRSHATGRKRKRRNVVNELNKKTANSYLVQDEAPTGAVLSAPHGMHAVAPNVPLNVLTAHIVQLAAPIRLLAAPRGHRAHALMAGPAHAQIEMKE
jgi:hypothetical protein